MRSGNIGLETAFVVTTFFGLRSGKNRSHPVFYPKSRGGRSVQGPDGGKPETQPFLEGPRSRATAPAMARNRMKAATMVGPADQSSRNDASSPARQPTVPKPQP